MSSVDLSTLFDPINPTFAGFDPSTTWTCSNEDVAVKYVNGHGGLDGRIPITDPGMSFIVFVLYCVSFSFESPSLIFVGLVCSEAHPNFMKPILRQMGSITRVLSWGGYREPFMCVGTCTASDIKSYDDAFLMNIQNFLMHPPKDSNPDKNSLMSVINHTFYQHNRPQFISNQQNQHDVLFARVIATNYILCTKCPPKSFPSIPQNPSRGITQEEIQRRSKHSYGTMISIARRMINDIGFLLINLIKSVRVSQGVRVRQLKLWDPEAPWMSYVRSSEIVRERCSGREGGVVVSWKQKIGSRPKCFLPHYIFFRPFVSVPHARLTVLAGEAFSAVTRPGKVYNDRARGIRNLSDRILSVGQNDTEEHGIPDESDDSSVESSANQDGHVNDCNEEDYTNGSTHEDEAQDGSIEELNGVQSEEVDCNNEDLPDDAVTENNKVSNFPVNPVDE